MAGLPTLSVKLDDGTGTFPHDVTAYAHLPTGIGVSRGRGDEAGSVEPSQLTLRFDNVDGRFTLGSATYGIAIDQRIRVTETVGGTTSIRFTGYVQDWPTSWPSPTGSYAVAQVTAVDRLARLARRKLRSVVENEIMANSPVAYYTLGDAAGSTSASDTSGYGRDPLSLTGAGPALAFGQSQGPTGDEGLTSVRFNANMSGLGYQSGKFLAGNVSGWDAVSLFFQHNGPEDSSNDQVLCAAQNASGAYVSVVIGATYDGGTLRLRLSGSGPAELVTGSPNVCDGAVHHFAWRPSTGEVWLDGVQLDATSTKTVATPTRLYVGRSPEPSGIEFNFDGWVAHVALFAALPNGARIAALSSAGLTGSAGDSSSARIGRLASYANIPTAEQSLEAGALTSVPVQAMRGAGPLDAMLDVEAAEGGSLFVNGAGTLVFQNRTHRTTKATSAAALALVSADIDDPIVTGDKQYLENYITGTREGGATQVALNQASIDQYEQYPAEVSRALYTTDDQVRDLINWRVTVYGTPTPRMSSVRLDLRTLPQATQQAALNLEIGDRVTISGLPSQSPFATADLIVEGWHEEISDHAWTLTLNTVPASVYRAWLLGDATYGLLGTTTRLHY